MGFCALSATSTHSVVLTASLRRHVQQGSQPHRLSALDVSHVLDGFVRCVPCGFISPRSRFQGSLRGVVPPTQPRHLVGSRLPSRRLTSPRYSRLPDCATLRRPILRAFIRIGICLSLAASVTPRRRAVPFESSSSRFSRLACPYRLWSPADPLVTFTNPSSGPAGLQRLRVMQGSVFLVNISFDLLGGHRPARGS